MFNNSIDATFPCLDTFSHINQQPGVMLHDCMYVFCVCVYVYVYVCMCIYYASMHV